MTPGALPWACTGDVPRGLAAKTRPAGVSGVRSDGSFMSEEL